MDSMMQAAVTLSLVTIIFGMGVLAIVYGRLGALPQHGAAWRELVVLGEVGAVLSLAIVGISAAIAPIPLQALLPFGYYLFLLARWKHLVPVTGIDAGQHDIGLMAQCLKAILVGGCILLLLLSAPDGNHPTVDWTMRGSIIGIMCLPAAFYREGSLADIAPGRIARTLVSYAGAAAGLAALWGSSQISDPNTETIWNGLVAILLVVYLVELGAAIWRERVSADRMMFERLIVGAAVVFLLWYWQRQSQVVEPSEVGQMFDALSSITFGIAGISFAYRVAVQRQSWRKLDIFIWFLCWAGLTLKVLGLAPYFLDAAKVAPSIFGLPLAFLIGATAVPIARRVGVLFDGKPRPNLAG